MLEVGCFVMSHPWTSFVPLLRRAPDRIRDAPAHILPVDCSRRAGRISNEIARNQAIRNRGCYYQADTCSILGLSL